MSGKMGETGIPFPPVEPEHEFDPSIPVTDQLFAIAHGLVRGGLSSREYAESVYIKDESAKIEAEEIRW